MYRQEDCVSLISVDVIDAVTRTNSGREGFIWFILWHLSPSWREARAGTQAGIWRQELKQNQEGTLLAGLLSILTLLVFLYSPGPLSRVGTTHSGLGPPASAVSQENDP